MLLNVKVENSRMHKLQRLASRCPIRSIVHGYRSVTLHHHGNKLTHLGSMDHLYNQLS